jgi:hypothetical protein
VRATPAGLFLDGELRILRDDVAGGAYEVRDDTPLLRVTDVKGRNVEIRVSGFGEATALFTALSVTPRTRFAAAWSRATPRRTWRIFAKTALGLVLSAFGAIMASYPPMLRAGGAALLLAVAWSAWARALLEAASAEGERRDEDILGGFEDRADAARA